MERIAGALKDVHKPYKPIALLLITEAAMTHEQAFWVDIALLIALLQKGRSQDAMSTNIPDNVIDPRDHRRS